MPEAPRTRSALESRLSWRPIIADQSEARIYHSDTAVTYLQRHATMRNPSARRPEHLPRRTGNAAQAQCAARAGAKVKLA